MKDPYGVLGISPGADDFSLREAYRRLVRAYENNPRKLEEINNAYDSVILARGAGGYAAAGGGASAQYAAPPRSFDFEDVQKRIRAGRFDDALTLLDGMPAQQRGAEWYYLKGCAQRGRGWLEEAEKLFYAAAQMDSARREYRTAYEEMRSRRQNGYQGNHRGKEKDDDRCCGICGSLLCADCCCECFGGDLIPCC
ncbi:MAG: J domain-containing protein [Oscillospiraceae bacterium]|jgi:curved DNA-binding protein CbpA|nr:J domain-containing protein [Oscillospiraceae bacterium]